MTDREHVQDGVKPTVPQIRERYDAGRYDHTIDATIGVLLDFITEMRFALHEINDGFESALRGWEAERKSHDQTRALLTNKENING